MGILASDNFNRADDPTSLGTATTGQVWTQTIVGVNAPSFKGFGIVSNQACRFANPIGESGVNAFASVDGRTINIKVQAQLPTPTVYQGRIGILARFLDTNNYMALFYDQNFPALRFTRVWNGLGSEFNSLLVTLSPNDTIGLQLCGNDITNWRILVNGVEYTTGGDDHPERTLTGTGCGLYAQDAIIGGNNNLYDNFIAESIAGCAESTWNCTAAQCIDPNDGTGTYSTLELCLASGCQASYNCVDGGCVDPGDGSGTYATLAECVESGCGASPTVTGMSTVRFDAGLGNRYYLVAPVVDSGQELRSKTVKAVRVTGRLTNAASKVYGYDVSDPIVVSDLEDGTNSTTGSLVLSDTTQVAQSPRTPINVPNAVLQTVRVEGDDTGQTNRDQIHEIVTEVAEQGVRR